MTSIAIPEPLDRRDTRAEVITFTAGVAGVALVGAADGAYFPSAWGWTAVALWWAAALALLVAPRRPALPQLAAPGLLLLLAVGALALAPGVPAALEAQRTLVYVGGLLALALVLRRRATGAFLGGLHAGISLVSCYALATRLFPDRLGRLDPVAGYRLAEPLGYWNALAIFAALGVLLALGLAVRTRAGALRALAAATLVPLALVIYFTFSRGGWIALAMGLAAALVLDRRRVSFVTWCVPLLAWPALAVRVAWSRDALTTVDAPLALAVEQGVELALVTAACMLAAALTVLAVGAAEARLTISRRLARAYAGGLAVSTAAALVAVFVVFGAPWTLAQRGWDSFSAPPPAVTDLNQRLFSLSGSGRVTQWESALDAWRDEPVLGIGAGGYEAYWLEHRELPAKVRDAHSLYLETLAELGVVGLALLLLALSVPVYAAFRARRHPIVPAALGAYVAYLVHAGVDWDWEMPAVTLTALSVGATVLVAARPEDADERPMSPRFRYSLLAATLTLAGVAFVGLVGNMAVAQSADAARAADWGEAESKARRAAAWAPWSAEPWQQLGRTQLARGELAAAQSSFRRAIAKDTRDWELWFDLGRASQGAAQNAALAQATRLNPLSPEIARLRQELAEFSTIAVGG